MSQRETADEIDAVAATWAIRLDESGCEPQALPGLGEWLAGDRRRAGALLRAQAALALLERNTRAAGTVSQTAVARPFLDRRIGRRAIIGWAAAAAVGSAAATVALYFRAPSFSRKEAPVFRTALGEILRVPLSDGTVAMLNTQTELAVSFSSTERHLELRRGQAWFAVARDANRPFIVTTGSAVVRAVGTEFSVWLRGTGTEVLVSEGVVRAAPAGSALQAIAVKADTRAFLPVSGSATLAALDSSDVVRLLAWRDGQIVLGGQSVAQAAEEFNRYNARKLVIADPALGAEKVIGRFYTNQPLAFADAVAGMFDARVQAGPSSIRLFRSRAGQNPLR